MLVVLALAAGVASAGAQDASANATVTGEIRDGLAETPVVNAAVQIPSLGRVVYTDATGRFRMAGIPAGALTLQVVALGYSTLNQEVEVGDGDHLIINLSPRPVTLEALQVTAEGLERVFRDRRNEAPVSLRMLGPEEMLRGGTQSAQAIVARHVRAAPCRANDDRNECIYRRGRNLTAPPQQVKVFVDELPFSGLTELREFHASELYAIEIWDDGAMVRVFTKAFAERLAMGTARFERIEMRDIRRFGPAPF